MIRPARQTLAEVPLADLSFIRRDRRAGTPHIPKIVRNADSTPLTVEVTAAGPNEFDFDLGEHAGTKR
jgi:hypothetical protein